MELFRNRRDKIAYLKQNLSPVEASQRLIEMGLLPETWDTLARQRGYGSHELRVLLRIARSGGSGDLKDIYIAGSRKGRK